MPTDKQITLAEYEYTMQRCQGKSSDDAMKAALEAAEAAAWEPMETAPEDTVILIYGKTGHYKDLSREEPELNLAYKIGGRHIIVNSTCASYGDAEIKEPSLWRHTPTPPTEKGEE